MQVRSLGYRTDLIFARYQGMIVDRGDYLVIRNASNPGYYWGNYLLFRDPPGQDALPEWKRLFHDEIAAHQPAPHLAFGWDSPEGEPGVLEPFLAEGFIRNEDVVLTTGAVSPPPENQVVYHAAKFPMPAYRTFKARQMEDYRRMADAGLGAWLGAFLDGRLVADRACSWTAPWRGSRRWRRIRTIADAASAARWCTRAPAARRRRWARNGW